MKQVMLRSQSMGPVEENHNVSLSCSNILKEMNANHDKSAHNRSVDLKVQDEEEKNDSLQNLEESKWILHSSVHF